MNSSKLLEDYMTFRAIDCKNKDALSNYKRYVGRFLDTNKINEKYLTAYINKISNDFSQTTLNVIKPLLKNFIKWHFPDYSLKFRNLDKLCRTKRAGNTYTAEQMLTEKEVNKIIETEDDLFWKVFWLVYFYGGFRPVDTIRLKKEMFSFEKDGMTIIKSYVKKNNKTFYKSIPANITPLIKKWFDINHSEWVFPSPKGDKPIHQKTPHKRLERISLKALGKKVNPYILRHSLASIKYNEEGLKDGDVANQLGHSKSMKETYTNLDENKLKARAKRVWTNKKEMPKKEKDMLLNKIKSQDKKLIDLIIKVDELLSGGYEKEMEKIYKQFEQRREKKEG